MTTVPFRMSTGLGGITVTIKSFSKTAAPRVTEHSHRTPATGHTLAYLLRMTLVSTAELAKEAGRFFHITQIRLTQVSTRSVRSCRTETATIGQQSTRAQRALSNLIFTTLLRGQRLEHKTSEATHYKGKRLCHPTR